MFKKLLCFSAAFVLVLTSFIVPSYADTGVSLASIVSNVSTNNNTAQNISYNNGILSFTTSSGTNTTLDLDLSESFDSIYFPIPSQFLTYSAQPTNFTFVFPSLADDNFTYNGFVQVVGNSFYLCRYDFTTTSSYIENINFSNQLQVRFASYNNVINYSIDLNKIYVNGNAPSPSVDPIYDDLPNFNIQRGYAAYIDFGSDWSTRSISGTLTSSFPQYSSLISGDWDGTDNRRYFWTDSLPSNTNFTSNVGSAIDWTKVPPYDLLQRSKNGIWFIQSNSPLNRYLVIVNPNQWRYGQNPTDDTINSPITVSDLSGSTGDVQFFALNQKFDTDGTLVSAASDSASNNRTGTYDPDTGQWEMTDSNGNAADQVPGGESDTPVISSISDYIHNITSVLTNFANSVISLIQAPISHISELIDAGSGFMQALRGMYAWLPVDIQGLVISALSVVIGIGVFKVFL